MEENTLIDTNNENLTEDILENEIDEIPGNETDEILAVDTLASTLDYYDRYYEKMLENSNTIIVQHQSILNNQDNIIEQNNTLVNLGYCTIFIISIFLLYNFLRNMIIVK